MTPDAMITQSFFEISRDLMTVAEADGRLLKFNGAWTEVLGYSESELSSRPFLEFVHPDDRLPTIEASQRLARGEEIVDFENRYIAKDGSMKWLSWRSKRLDERGHCLAVAREVTGEKRDQALFERVLGHLGGATGDVFVSLVTEVLAADLHWDAAVLSELKPDGASARVLRRWSGGKFLAHSEFEIKGEPTADVLRFSRLTVQDGLAQAYPSSVLVANGGYRSYVGHLIRGALHQPIGFIELYASGDTALVRPTERLLKVLAVRVGAEFERQRHEHRLLESQGRHRFIASQVSDIIHSHDLDGRCTFANPALKRTLGYEPADVLGRTPFHFLHPEDRGTARRAHHAVVHGALERSIACRVRAKSGAWRWLECSLQGVRDPHTDQFLEILCVSRDITARKIEEEERGKAALRQKLHVQQTPLAVVEFSPCGEITEWNPAAERIFGWRREEILGRHFTTLVPDDQRDEIRRLMSSLISQSGGFRMANATLRKDGKRILCEWYNTPLIEADGTTVGVASLVQDVTDRHSAQEMIEKQRLQMVAASKMSALGEMAAGIAHEINNPLAIIFGRVEQLRAYLDRGDAPAEKLKEIARSIGLTAERIARIVAGLRFFARDGARDSFELRPLADLVEETLGFCRSRFRNHKVALELDPSNEPVQLECRPVQISQVLLNLLNNAFDATQNLEDRWIRISWRELGDDVELRVVDSGRGIPPRTAERIMTPFFTTKELGKGTGLGLSISRGIVESHLGTLELDRAAPYTTFVIRLPKLQLRGKVRGEARSADTRSLH